MKSLNEMRAAPLQWKQPLMKDPAFELSSGDDVLAILQFKNSFGSLAEGITAESSWTFKTQGFLKTYVTIRETGTENNLAVFHNNTWSGGGTLEFPDGHKYLANSNYWHAQFEFSNEAGETLMQFTNIGGFKLHAQLEIMPTATNLQEIPLLVVLGWYLAVMASREGEMVAALF